MKLSSVASPYGGRHDLAPHHSRGRDTSASHHPTGVEDFVCIDGEGITLSRLGGPRLRDTSRPDHRYVLLGAGEVQIENPSGLDYMEILPFLYEQFKPRTAYVGFYLGYDFTQWLKTLPEDRVRRLITIDGRESRRSQSPAMHGKFLPVDVDEWQIDMLGSKRFQFRRKECSCETVKCPHPKGPWMYICDAGGFFQTSFLNVINPENWQTPILSVREYDTILEGKAARGSAELDDDMRKYNRLENDVFRRVMHDLNDGFRKLDVNLPAQSWFGAGQAAQAWMRNRAPKRTVIEDAVPDWFADAARQSYFGGWFEQQAHGHIPGVTYENDINNAYPFIIATLPCLLHGTYTRGIGKPPPMAAGTLCLVRALVWGQRPHSERRRGTALGAMLHRDAQGRICRPIITSGWYWLDELQSAINAKCVMGSLSPANFYEWVAYAPCDCKPPLWQVKHLYQMRLDIGKKSSLGKAAKTTNNSIYGKTAQSVGMPQYANPVYASRITSGCRRMILDAIATHPGGKSNVVMVATDAVFFLDPHPLLTYGKGLGEWECEPRNNLTLFKPGVYWDDAARDRIAAGEHPNFKARGISAKDFASTITQIDNEFSMWGDDPPPIDNPEFTPEQLQAMGAVRWPKVRFTSGFAMVTALQALTRNEWSLAGSVSTGKELVQNANPEDKRTDIWYDRNGGRPVYRSEPHIAGSNAVHRHSGNISEWGTIKREDYSSAPYEKRFGMDDPFSDEYTQRDGVSPDEHQIGRGMFRILTGQE